MLGVGVWAGMFSAGCMTEYNLATQREERSLYGVEKEIKIGDAVAKQFDSHYPLSSDVEANERAQRILAKIVAVCDRQELVYTIKIIEEDKMNAVSLPGGYIYIYKGLIDRLDNDDQLASVIAHEVAHIAARHGIKRLEGIYGYAILQLLALRTGDAKVARGIQTAYLAMFFEYSREDEFLADKLGVKYMREAGYNPEEMAKVLRKLQEQQKKEPLQELSYWRTHPHIPERIAVVNTEVSGEMNFKDYLNIMDVP